MRQKKIPFSIYGSPPSTGTGNDGVTQGTGNPSPEEWEFRQLPTQQNNFPRQKSYPNQNDEALDLTLGESTSDRERGERD